MAEALINGGADIEAPGGSIGTPLHNAVGYGCWHVARLLVQRGAQVNALWEAAALGMMTRVDELLARTPAPEPEDITEAFWQACQRTLRGGECSAGCLVVARKTANRRQEPSSLGSCRRCFCEHHARPAGGLSGLVRGGRWGHRRVHSTCNSAR